MSRHRVTMIVNGEQRQAEVDARKLLVHFLRDDLGLTSTHVGCDTIQCGACTVHRDGSAVKPCTVLAVQADEAAVNTAESLHKPGDPEHPLPAGEFFTTDGPGPGGKATTLRRGELLTAATVPAAGPQTRSTYLKRMHPASGHGMIGVAVAAAFDTSGACAQCRIAVTRASAIASRAARAEEHLTGSRLTASTGQTRQKSSANSPRARLRLVRAACEQLRS